jgi:hypothetical protein
MAGRFRREHAEAALSAGEFCFREGLVGDRLGGAVGTSAWQ